jgi:hypothetical protein
MTMPPFTPLELFSHCLKSMKVNFNSFSGQHNQQILNIIEPLEPVLEIRVRNRFPLPTSLKQLEDVERRLVYNFSLEIVQNLHDSIPRRITAVLKIKGGSTPYK